MLKIGITSNIKKYYSGHIDFIDSYWISFFEKKKIDFKIMPNSKSISEKILKEVNFLILSGGNDILSNKNISKIRNQVEFNLLNKAIKKKIPILGICRGAQLINLFLGGKIKKLQNHMNKRHEIFFESNKIFNIKNLNVNSFHNYGVLQKNKAVSLDVLASDKKGNIEMFISKNKKIIGSMWHPEREKNSYYLSKLINYLKNK